MARLTHDAHAGRRWLAAALVAAFLLGLAPVRWIGWVTGLSAVARALVAPVSGPASAVSRYLRPADLRDPDPALVRQLQDERDRAVFLYEQARREVDRLRKLMSDLEGGVEINPGLPVRQAPCPVVARSGDLSSRVLTIRPPGSFTADPGTVAVTEGVQVVGRVVQSAGPTALVRAITDAAAGAVEGLVMVPGTDGLLCRLEPTADGLLRGPVESPASREGEPAPEVTPGLLVRLSDRSWPASSQMLELGRVERVDPDPDQPLRRVITVRPRVQLERVAEVVLRLPPEDGGAGR